eukprot:gene14198-19052_t
MLTFSNVLQNNAVYYIALVSTYLITFSGGYNFISYLRTLCRTSSIPLYQLTLVVYITPICLYITLSLINIVVISNQLLIDITSLGFISGILYKLQEKSNSTSLDVKLIVKQLNGTSCEIWLNSINSSVKEIRAKVADILLIQPATRINFESGKGNFIEDLSKPLYNYIDETSKKTDFFGYVTYQCYIDIKDETHGSDDLYLIQSNDTLNRSNREVGRRESTTNPFRGLIKGEIKYGDPLTLYAKIPSAESKSFNISLIDKFVVASPIFKQAMPLQTSMHSIHMISWDAALVSGTNNNSNLSTNNDNISDVGELSVNNENEKPSPGLFGIFAKKNSADLTFAKPVQNGDQVVLECDGKYMSIARGWWMAWSSSTPRRSGVFIIEVIEKVPPNKLKEQIMEQFENFKSMGRTSQLSPQKDVTDKILRPGDLFRLRSAKFPEFELGVTNIKLRDEFCYLGLRKISSSHESTAADSWCIPVIFA